MVDNAKVGESVDTYSLFTKANVTSVKKSVQSAVDKATFLILDFQSVQNLKTEAPSSLELMLPFNQDTLTLELIKVNVLTEDFTVITNTSNGQSVDYAPGLYYQGILKGDNQSIVAISIFEQEVMGMISTSVEGNLILGKLDEGGNTDRYILYDDRNLKNKPNLNCSTETPENYGDYINQVLNGSAQQKNNMNNCIRIFIESDYALYLNRGSIAETINYLSGMLNEVKALYTTESINITLSQVYVWDTQDSYSHLGSMARNQFKNARPSFNADLALLAAVGPGGLSGIAPIATLCTDDNYAYANIQTNAEATSGTVWVVTHELGHSIGSPHTHECAWNGNNTPIDGCGPQVEGIGCSINCILACFAPIPPLGTIMSYCFLPPNPGIDFSGRPFGNQPGNLIQAQVNLAGCLSSLCFSPPIPDLAISTGTQSVSMSTVLVGGNIVAYCSEDNSGTATAATNAVALYLSTDAILTPGSNGDTYLDFINFSSLPPSSNSVVNSNSIQIPNGTPPGNYYLFFWADGGEVVTESNEINNFATIQITVIAPDLTITAGTQTVAPSTIAAGGNITAYCSEDNSGNATAAANTVTLYLSSDAVLTPGSNGDIYLDFVNFPSLTANSNSIVNSKSIQIPNNTAPGIYYLFFWADGGQVVSESNETNNFATVQITVPPFIGCPTSDMNFTTQAQIDAFPTNYPECTNMPYSINIQESVPGNIINLNGLSQLISIEGYLSIGSNAALTSLTGLNSLNSIGQGLSIGSNDALTSLTGLNSLTSVAKGVFISNNPVLTNLTGLSSVTFIGFINIRNNLTLTSLIGLNSITHVSSLAIENNAALTNLIGLNSLTSVGNTLPGLVISSNASLTSLTGLNSLTSTGRLNIRLNPILTNLTGLNSLTSIGVILDIHDNSALISLTGLNSLTSVGNSINIYNNYSLTSLEGLNALTSIGGTLRIDNNYFLTSLTGLNNINPNTITNLFIQNSDMLSLCEVQSICDYLAIPSNPATIFGNAIGCATRTEIEAACLALPIELISFTGKNLGNNTVLSWQTASEQNNDYFLVGHSRDGRNFKDIGSLKSHGDSYEPQSYSFIHPNPPTGVNYYRLKQVDFDGKYEYSKLISVDIEHDEISIFPNPTTGIIEIQGKNSDEGTIRLTDNLGRLLIIKQKLSDSEQIDISDMPNGMYFMEILTDARSIIRRIIKE